MEHDFTGEVASIVLFKVDHALLVYFVEDIVTTDFCAHFNISRLQVKRFLKWIISSNIVPEKRTVNVMSAK